MGRNSEPRYDVICENIFNDLKRLFFLLMMSRCTMTRLLLFDFPTQCYIV